MSEAYKQDCAIIDCEQQVDIILIVRAIDQEFQRLSKFYCPFHADKLPTYLEGVISFTHFTQLKQNGGKEK